jgi:hypothetical protein
VRPYQLAHKKDARVHCVVLKVRATKPGCNPPRTPRKRGPYSAAGVGPRAPAAPRSKTEGESRRPRGSANVRRALRTQQRAYSLATTPTTFRPGEPGVLTRGNRLGRTGQCSTREHRGGMNIRLRAWTAQGPPDAP